MKSLVSQSRKLIWKLDLIGCSPSVWGEGATPSSGYIRIFQQGHPQSQQEHPCFLCLRPRMPEEWASAEGLSGCPENCLCGVLSKLTIKAPNGQKPVSDFPCISQNTHSCAGTQWTLSNLVGLTVSCLPAFGHCWRPHQFWTLQLTCQDSRVAKMNYHLELF